MLSSCNTRMSGRAGKLNITKNSNFNNYFYFIGKSNLFVVPSFSSISPINFSGFRPSKDSVLILGCFFLITLINNIIDFITFQFFSNI